MSVIRRDKEDFDDLITYFPTVTEEFMLEDFLGDEIDFIEGDKYDHRRKRFWESVVQHHCLPFSEPHEIKKWVNEIRFLSKFFDAISNDLELSVHDGDGFGGSSCLKGVRIDEENPEIYIFYIPFNYKHWWQVEGRPEDYRWRWFNPRDGVWFDSEPDWSDVNHDWIMLLERIR